MQDILCLQTCFSVEGSNHEHCRRLICSYSSKQYVHAFIVCWRQSSYNRSTSSSLTVIVSMPRRKAIEPPLTLPTCTESQGIYLDVSW